MKQLFYSFMTTLVALLATTAAMAQQSTEVTIDRITYHLDKENYEAKVSSVPDDIVELTIPSYIPDDNNDNFYSIVGFSEEIKELPNVTRLNYCAPLYYLSKGTISSLFPNLSILDVSKLDTESLSGLDQCLAEDNNLEYILAGDNYTFLLYYEEIKEKVVRSIPDYAPVPAGEVLLYAEDLMRFNTMVYNGAYVSNTSYTFKLAEDIIISPSNNSSISAYYEYDIPICKLNWTKENSITLSNNWTFDGQGHSIKFSSPLLLDGESTYDTNIPLFANVASGATVKNCIVYSNDYSGVSYKHTLMSEDNSNVSPFIAKNDGTVERCMAVNFDYEVVVTGSYTHNNISVGLLVGDNNGIVKDCAGYKNKVTLTEENNCAIDNAYIGGLVGNSSNNATVQDCIVAEVEINDNPNTVANEDNRFCGVISGNGNTSNLYYCDALYNEDYQSNDVNPCKIIRTGTELAMQADKLSAYTVLNLSDPTQTQTEKFADKISNRAAWTYLSWEMMEGDMSVLSELMVNDNSFPVPMMMDVDVAYDNDSHVALFELNGINDWNNVTTLISANYDEYKNAIVKLENDIVADASETRSIADLEKLVASGENVIKDVPWYFGWNELASQDKPFCGTFDGQGFAIRNVVIDGYDGNCFLGYLGQNSLVKNLAIENVALILEDSYIENMSQMTDAGGKKKLLVPILAHKAEGNIQNVSFVGNLYIDDFFAKSCANQGFDIEWTPVADAMPATSSISNSLFYITNLENLQATVSDGNNKRNIVIMQNMGVGRNAGQTQKVCNNRKNKNKSLSASPAADVNNDYREYTDDEMASGEPAYWLNYTGKGYSGIYSRQWSKGKMYPIMATELSKPAVKIVYDIDGVTESEAGLVKPLFFANEDDDIEINLTSVPDKVWVGDGAKELNSSSKITKKLLASACKNGIVTIHLKYGDPTAIDSPESSLATSITANGQTIAIANAAGSDYSIVDLLGHSVASGSVNSSMKSIIVPSAGIYIVKVGDLVKKIVIR